MRQLPRSRDCVKHGGYTGEWNIAQVFQKLSLAMEGMGTNPIMMFIVQLLSHVLLFWDPWGCSSPSSSVPGIFQARILEWVATSFSHYDIYPNHMMTLF